MDQYKGIVSVEILGRQRGFKFGTMQAALFCKELGVKLPDLPKLLDGSDLEAQIVWYWAAAVSYARLHKEDEPSKDEVAAWIDTYGFDNIESKANEETKIPNESEPTQAEKV